MQLVELHAMPSEKDISEKDADLLKNTGVKKKGTVHSYHISSSAMLTVEIAASSGTKMYILRSALDPALIQQACTPDAEIREMEQNENKDENEEFAEDDNLISTRSTGSIIAWHNADQLPSIGILYVILALILVEGRVISDSTFSPSYACYKDLSLTMYVRQTTSAQSSSVFSYPRMRLFP